MPHASSIPRSPHRDLLPLLIAIVAHLCAGCGKDESGHPAPPPASGVGHGPPAAAAPPALPRPGDTALGSGERPVRPPAPTRAPAAPTPLAPAEQPAAEGGHAAPGADRAAAEVPPPPGTAAESTVHAPHAPASAAERKDAERKDAERKDAERRRPFGAGERLVYDVRFGPLSVGTATMDVLGVEPVRGIPAWHIRFEVRGGNRFYRVEDRYESWFSTESLASLRYVQDIREGSYRRQSTFEIYPDRALYVESGEEPQPSVAHPLDEGSFIYWLRTIPLEVGRTYSFDNYFRPDRNPVRITVVRRERVRVPAGEFDAIVVRPTIRTRGIFSEGGRAEIWFADDSTRRILQMKSQLSFGSLNLYLKSQD